MKKVVQQYAIPIVGGTSVGVGLMHKDNTIRAQYKAHKKLELNLPEQRFLLDWFVFHTGDEQHQQGKCSTLTTTYNIAQQDPKESVRLQSNFDRVWEDEPEADDQDQKSFCNELIGYDNLQLKTPEKKFAIESFNKLHPNLRITINSNSNNNPLKSLKKHIMEGRDTVEVGFNFKDIDNKIYGAHAIAIVPNQEPPEHLCDVMRIMMGWRKYNVKVYDSNHGTKDVRYYNGTDQAVSGTKKSLKQDFRCKNIEMDPTFVVVTAYKNNNEAEDKSVTGHVNDFYNDFCNELLS